MNLYTKNGDLKIRWLILIAIVSLWLIGTIGHPLMVVAAATADEPLGDYIPIFDWWLHLL